MREQRVVCVATETKRQVLLHTSQLPTHKLAGDLCDAMSIVEMAAHMCHSCVALGRSNVMKCVTGLLPL